MKESARKVFFLASFFSFLLKKYTSMCNQSFYLSAFGLPHLSGIQVQDVEVWKSMYRKNMGHTLLPVLV